MYYLVRKTKICDLRIAFKKNKNKKIDNLDLAKYV